jgi:hypothetical protein
LRSPIVRIELHTNSHLRDVTERVFDQVAENRRFADATVANNDEFAAHDRVHLPVSTKRSLSGAADRGRCGEYEGALQ